MEYLFRYGDYLASQLSELKDAAFEEKTEGHQELRNYWTVIAEKLKAEKIIMNTRGYNVNPSEVTTLVAIWSAATALKISKDHAEWMIERYSERNLLAHSGLPELLQRGRWWALAHVLYNDQKDLQTTIPPGMEGDSSQMSAVVASSTKKYFTMRDGEEDDPETWIPNTVVVEDREALLKTKEVKKAELAEEMVKVAQEALKELERKKESVMAAINGKRRSVDPFHLAMSSE